ncbi:probable disease resistance protein RF9 [Lycium barbarum]|uniref:probable disease resistance protein RF9 n=1 Tax=Lycium barbarum TaxID=112863 RepID=UPI00293E1A6A|nr:probable disease resistance protein RF9 [Lycium barbarum]
MVVFKFSSSSRIWPAQAEFLPVQILPDKQIETEGVPQYHYRKSKEKSYFKQCKLRLILRICRFIKPKNSFEDQGNGGTSSPPRDRKNWSFGKIQWLREKIICDSVVIEDICSIDDWQRLRLAVGANGSRILVTTRAREVAENIIQTCYIHEKRPLTEEHSWDLLKRAAFPGKDPAEIKSSMEKIGRELVKQCEGIPGAIIALAKLLAKKDEKEWEIVQKNARSHLYNVMTPSYDDLSDHLKLCFLYLSHFREDPEIEPEKLSHLWTIEGLISSRECGRMMTLLDLTQEILMILAHKRMIDVEQLVDVKSCRLVGLMGDMCLLKAEERSLLKVIDLRSGDIPPSFSFGTTRRIVIYLGKHSPQFTPELAGKLRSLRIIRANVHQQVEELVFPSIMLELKKFKALRILDFDNIDFRGRKLPVGIFALSLLRYLSFKGCFLDALTSSIRNLTFLQVLDLRIKDSCKIIIPNALQRMGGLQHLYLPPAFQMRNGKKFRLDKLTKLQTLTNFTSNACEICDLFKLTKVRDLHTKIEGSHEDLQSITSHMKVAPEKWLRSSIEIKNFDCYTETRHDVLRQLLALGVPPILSFEGCIGHLPRYNLISERFTEIVLSSAQLKEDPMTTFEKLPRLRRLVLHDDAFIGTEMVCSASGFPELKHLELSNLFFLEKWTVEDKAMSRLSHLKINNCEKLLLPDGLEFLSTLQEIKTENMPKPFEVSLHKRYGKSS